MSSLPGASQTQIPRHHLEIPSPVSLAEYGLAEPDPETSRSAYDRGAAKKCMVAAQIMEQIAGDGTIKDGAEPRGKQSDAHGGDDIADRQQQALDELNEKYAVVNDSGKAVVFRRTRDQVLNRFMIERSSFDDFKRMYQNQKVPIATKPGKPPQFVALGQFWLNNVRRRQYLEGVTFDPTNAAPPGKWNMWAGFPTPPVPGDWNLMREHIRTVICNGDTVLFQYLM